MFYLCHLHPAHPAAYLFIFFWKRLICTIFFKLNIQLHSYLLVFILFKQSQRSKKTKKKNTKQMISMLIQTLEKHSCEQVAALIVRLQYTHIL